MTASNVYGRQVIEVLTNKSGGDVVLGDAVIVDTANNDAFTTTTSAATTAIVGIALETIASNAAGRVLTQGYAPLVNVNASVTRGHYGATHTVAKQVADSGTNRTTGTFCQFLTGGTTPDAHVFNPDLSGAALTNPMTTKGDIIQADTGGTPLRLGAGSSGQVLTSAGAAAFNAWGNVSIATAHSQVGYATAGGSWDNTAGSFLTFKKVTLAANSLILNVVAYVKGNATNVGSIWAGLYDDNAGVPGLLIAVSEVPEWTTGAKGVYLNTSARWLAFPVVRWVVAGDYWLMIGREQDISNDMQLAYDASGSDSTATLGAFWQEDASLVTVNTGTRKHSIYADILT